MLCQASATQHQPFLPMLSALSGPPRQNWFPSSAVCGHFRFSASLCPARFALAPACSFLYKPVPIQCILLPCRPQLAPRGGSRAQLPHIGRSPGISGRAAAGCCSCCPVPAVLPEPPPLPPTKLLPPLPELQEIVLSFLSYFPPYRSIANSCNNSRTKIPPKKIVQSSPHISRFAKWRSLRRSLGSGVIRSVGTADGGRREDAVGAVRRYSMTPQ